MSTRKIRHGERTEEWNKVGNYEYHKGNEIGKGNYGKVYEGRTIGRAIERVAIKVIENTSNPNINREIGVLKEISRLNHTNIVQLLYSEEQKQPKALFLVMELCNEDMAKYLEKNKPLSEAAVAIFSWQIVKGLQVLKAHKIIHRDLKPQNFLLCYGGSNPKPEDITVKIADFGFARFQPTGACQILSFCGSLEYMAPEAMTSNSYGSEVDIWSAGVMIHVMAFGSLPFERSILETAKSYKCPTSASPQLQDLLNGMLKQEPSERPDLQSLSLHDFFDLQRKKDLPQFKENYLPEHMSRSEKRRLYNDAVTWENIPTWHDSPSTNATQNALFEIDNDLNKKVSIWAGDITKIEVDAIVHPSNLHLKKESTKGVSQAIHSAAGSLLEKETSSIGRCALGSAEVTAGYMLPAYYVIHTVGPRNGDSKVLSSCYKSCLEKVSMYNLRTVAFPTIATGNLGFPVDKGTKIAMKSVREWLKTADNRAQVDRVIFVCFTLDSLESYEKYMDTYFPKL